MQVRLTTNTDFRRRRAGASSSGTTRAADAVRAEQTPFQQILEEILPRGQVASANLHELWQKLPDAERELLGHPSNANLAHYKEVVIAIARETLKRNTRIRKIRRKNRKGELVELSLVEFIDSRLQKMANMMSAPGNSAFFLLKTVEEIRGVLLDVRE